MKILYERFPRDRGIKSSLYKHAAEHVSDDGYTREVRFNDEKQKYEPVRVLKNSPGDFTTYEYETPNEYDDGAQALQDTEVHTSDENSGDRVVGYVTVGGYIIKYDTKAYSIVMYNPRKPVEMNTISYYATNRPSRYAELKRQRNSRYKCEVADYKKYFR